MPTIAVKDANGSTQTIQTVPAVGQSTSANSLPVVVASDQGSLPISASTLPLPTGAAQDGTLTARLGTLGQKAMAASTPVVIASDQSAIPVDTVVKGTATNRSGTITAGGTAQILAASNASRRGVRIQNQSSGALYFSQTGTATQDQNSFLLNAGDYFESSTQFVGTGAISIIGATTGQAFHAVEF